MQARLIIYKPFMQDSQAAELVVNNGERYSVTIPNYHRVSDHIIYQTHILDSAFILNHTLYFRFRSLRKLHQDLQKDIPPNSLPDFPKTRSFVFWNRTNSDLTLIRQRIRQLQYYLTKLLNNSRLFPSPHVQRLFRSIRLNTFRRPSSEPPSKQLAPLHSYPKECPELYHRLPVLSHPL